jgi:cytochrome c oxidase assembly protein subunit 15
MVHRYLAMAVGALIVALNVALWRSRGARASAPWWAAAALVWVVVQGLFGRYTVMWKLYPVVVTAHLLGGMVLLALLIAQLQALRGSPRLSAARGAGVVLLLVAVQIALGGWVSSNYAVLACRGFPTCNGQWWPDPDFAQGFQLLRELGRAGTGYVDFHALVAIQFAHRLFATVVTVAVAILALRLWRSPEGDARRVAVLLALLLAAQVASGLSNVLLDWPLAAALAHTAGAAGLVALLMSLAMRRAAAESSLTEQSIGARWRHGRA